MWNVNITVITENLKLRKTRKQIYDDGLPREEGMGYTEVS